MFSLHLGEKLQNFKSIFVGKKDKTHSKMFFSKIWETKFDISSSKITSHILHWDKFPMRKMIWISLQSF